MENQEYTKESVALSQEEATVESQSLSKSIPNVDENALKEREAAAVALEGKLAALQQELAAKESGLAQKAIYLDELFASLTEQEKKLTLQALEQNKQQQVQESREQALLQRETSVEQSEESLQNISKQLGERSLALDSRENQLTQRENEMKERETAEQETIRRVHLQAQQEIAQKKENFAEKLEQLRLDKIKDLETQMENMRKVCSEQLDKIQEKQNQACAQRFEQVEKEIQQKRADADEAIQIQKQQNAEYECNLKKREEKLQDDEKEVDFKRELNQSKEKKLNEDRRRLDAIIEDKLTEKRRSMETVCASMREEMNDLLQNMNLIEQQNRKFERIISRFGSDPNEIQKKLDADRAEIDRLQTIVLNFNQHKVDDYDRLAAESDRIKAELSQTREELSAAQFLLMEADKIRNKNIHLNTQIESLTQQMEAYKSEIHKREEIIERLRTPEEQRASREERIQEIKTGYLSDLPAEEREYYKTHQPESELAWLTDIEQKCNDYGIPIPQRILYAFHTALKIADWSTIAVLAGVSGTGKSELPNLYSLFGGINFINVPVQPNWDSQEAMLGYFNSIDNRFEAQEVLRFLAQCTDKEQYGDYMAIVLLDEMNLAHVELYFAEFLSKLEERRGKVKDKVPSVEVKLGGGLEPYRLKMYRNVLWTGTMNQDETTKSLSDKVLDRGIVINFPRPTSLRSRTKMKDKEQYRNRVLLQYSTWRSWVPKSIAFEGKQRERIEKYRGIVDQINNLLEKVGRALGHRVWQSIEYYIANYPTVLSAQNEINRMVDEQRLEKGDMTGELAHAMRNAFEDQIVQKIMPKLRGIETSGRGEEQLHAIQALLDSEDFGSLDDDFNNAMELGYGQFMWSSAKYLENDEVIDTVTESEMYSDEMLYDENTENQ